MFHYEIRDNNGSTMGLTQDPNLKYIQEALSLSQYQRIDPIIKLRYAEPLLLYLCSCSSNNQNRLYILQLLGLPHVLLGLPTKSNIFLYIHFVGFFVKHNTKQQHNSKLLNVATQGFMCSMFVNVHVQVYFEIKKRNEERTQ